MANQPSKPSPPQQSAPAKSTQQATAGEPNQPLRPPLPPATSAPPRQEPPNPTPELDEPAHDQRRFDQGAYGVDRSTLTPEQATGVVTEPHPPQKYRRPLPQPGENDYVAGQPVNEEEAQRMEKLEQDRYDFAQKAGKDAEARRQDARSDDQVGQQHPGTPGKQQPDHGEPLHRPSDKGKTPEQKR